MAKLIGSSPNQVSLNGMLGSLAFQNKEAVNLGSLTVNNNLVLSVGTANGVTYLNTSKALTAGNALNFNGTRLEVLNTAPAIYISDSTASVGGSFGFFNGGVNYSYGQIALRDVTNSQTAYTYAAGASGYHNWFQNNSEQMRLTSTGLGIGTLAPNTKLDITTTANNGIRLFQTGAATAWNIYTSGNNLRFIEENVGAVMSINAGGNVGIGTTSPGSRLDVQGTSVVSSFLSSNNNNVIRLRGNNAANGAWLGTTNTDDFIFSNGATIAERMRIDASGNLGIGTTLPGTKLDVAGVDGQGIQFRTASRTIGIGQVSSEAAVYWGSGTALTFSSAAVERARIDSSGNLLVGTTTNTNSSRLTVNGTISETVSAVQYLVASQFDVGTAPNKIPLNQYLGNLAYQNASAIAGQAGFAAGTAALPSIASATDLTTGRWFPAAGVMAWSTSGVERMRLDASGNLGVAVVPSVNNGGAALQIGTVTALMGNSSESWVNNNATFNSGWKYIANGFASNYHQLSGTHRWNIAPSGTAGNAISFTQAMTLDASGNLGVGTTSPGAKLEVYQSANNIIRIGAAATSTAGVSFAGNGNSHGTTAAEIYQDSSSNFNVFTVASQTIRFGTNNSERARITGGGDFITALQTAAPTLTTNNHMVFTLTSNTNLRISVRGSDGVTRVANITLA